RSVGKGRPLGQQTLKLLGPTHPRSVPHLHPEIGQMPDLACFQGTSSSSQTKFRRQQHHRRSAEQDWIGRGHLIRWCLRGLMAVIVSDGRRETDESNAQTSLHREN